MMREGLGALTCKLLSLHAWSLLGAPEQPTTTKIVVKLFYCTASIFSTGGKCLHRQKALTLSFMPIHYFPWEYLGVKSYALQSVEQLF